MAIDPVCGMTVEEATAAATSSYQGHTYYFCAPGCKAAFDAHPADFVAAAQRAEPTAPDTGSHGHGCCG